MSIDLRVENAVASAEESSGKMKLFTEGDQFTSIPTERGNTPTLKKFLADKEAEINQSAEGILAQSVEAKNLAIAAKESATSSESIATQKATQASNSEAQCQAAVQTTTAATELAKKYANELEDVVVESNNYSAFHWAKKAEESVNQPYGLGGTFTPQTGSEYPDTTILTKDTIWFVTFEDPAQSYTLTGGNLVGKVVRSQDTLLFSVDIGSFELIPAPIVTGSDTFHYNIKEEGAKGDGVQDDTPYISPVHSNFVPAGLYNIDSSAVNLQNLYGSGLISNKGSFGTSLPNSLGDFSSKRVIHEFNIRFSSYAQALTLSTGASYLFPQSLEVFDNTIYIVYGAGGGSNAEMWIVAYSAEDFTEITTFKVSDRFGEGLAIYKEGANTFLMCRYNNAGVDKLGKFDITTLPSNLSTLTPISTYDIDVSSFVTTDGNYIYVQEKNRQGGLVKRNKIGIYKKDMTFLCYKFFDEKDFGTISSNSTQPKVQNFCAYGGNFLATYGSTHILGNPVSPSFQVGIKEFSDSCSQSDGFMIDGDTAINILRDEGYDVDLIEYEGLCEYNGIPITLLVTKSHTHTGLGGLLLVEEKSPSGISFSEARSLMGSETSNYSGAERVAQANDGIVNPLDSSLFSSTVQIMDWMYKSGTNVFSFYTTGSSISDVDGNRIGGGRFVKIKTGNFSSFDMKIESSTSEENYWITRASESNYTQTKKPTQSGGDEAISWDFEYVANDGLRLRSGYGNASNELDFSRASATSSINKSEILVDLTADEHSITNDGIESYRSFTNEALYSENCEIGWSNSGVLISDSSDNLSLGSSTKAKKIATDSSTGTHQVRQSGLSNVTLNTSVTLYQELKADEFKEVTVRVRGSGGGGFGVKVNLLVGSANPISNFGNGVYKKHLVEDLNDGWYAVIITGIPDTSSDGSVSFDTRIHNLSGSDNYPGDGVSGVILGRTQLTKMQCKTPYLKTLGVALSRSEDVISLKSMNNIPSSFSNLTIEVGALIPKSDGEYQNLFRADMLSNYFWMRRENDSEEVKFFSPPGALLFGTTTDDKHRFTITFDGSATKSFVDGVLINTIQSSISPVSTIDYNGNIHIAGNPAGGQNLNSEVKYFRIKHSALTDEQVAARGGY